MARNMIYVVYFKGTRGRVKTLAREIAQDNPGQKVEVTSLTKLRRMLGLFWFIETIPDIKVFAMIDKKDLENRWMTRDAKITIANCVEYISFTWIPECLKIVYLPPIPSVPAQTSAHVPVPVPEVPAPIERSVRVPRSPVTTRVPAQISAGFEDIRNYENQIRDVMCPDEERIRTMVIATDAERYNPLTLYAAAVMCNTQNTRPKDMYNMPLNGYHVRIHFGDHIKFLTEHLDIMCAILERDTEMSMVEQVSAVTYGKYIACGLKVSKFYIPPNPTDVKSATDILRMAVHNSYPSSGAPWRHIFIPESDAVVFKEGIDAERITQLTTMFSSIKYHRINQRNMTHCIRCTANTAQCTLDGSILPLVCQDCLTYGDDAFATDEISDIKDTSISFGHNAFVKDLALITSTIFRNGDVNEKSMQCMRRHLNEYLDLDKRLRDIKSLIDDINYSLELVLRCL